MKDSIKHILAILASAVKRRKKKGKEKKGSTEVNAENVKSAHRKKKPASGNLKQYPFTVFVSFLFLAVNASIVL